MSTKPHEVCVKGSDKLIGYACPKCHRFCSPLIYACGWDAGLTAAHQHAVTCCADRMCTECNVNMGPPKKTYWLICTSCRSKKDSKRENKLFQEAEKILLSEYKHDMLYYMDEYYDGDTIQDKYTFDEPPKYAWACYPKKFTLDASRLISDEIESQEHHEDAYDDLLTKDVDRLQRYFNAWCKHVDVTTWMPNFKLAVILPRSD